MAIVVLSKKPTKKDIQKALEEYPSYIKITIDIKNETVAIGGEYHADAEKILINKHSSNSNDIWGGGYNLDTKTFETVAMVNLFPARGNNSMEILDSATRKKFLEIAKQTLRDINKLT